jgi:8-oxo-dGTP pyrophosphatase MutT (NUDIX family)
LRFNRAAYVPFAFQGARIGWLRPALAARLAAWPHAFAASPQRVELVQAEALAPILEQLAREGFIPGWRGELYRIADLFEIERAAARPFGLTTHAVHLNGVVAGSGMWLARRSATKPIDPGLLDNLVGGGFTAGLSVEQVLVNEAWEEAGIPAELARGATRGGIVSILREVPEGVQSEVIDVYDLAVPATFDPHNQDGEVSEFMLLPFDQVERRELTFEAALVAADYFKRNARPLATAL